MDLRMEGMVFQTTPHLFCLHVHVGGMVLIGKVKVGYSQFQFQHEHRAISVSSFNIELCSRYREDYLHEGSCAFFARILLEGQIQETIPKRDHLRSFSVFVALNLLVLPHIIFSFAAHLSRYAELQRSPETRPQL